VEGLVFKPGLRVAGARLAEPLAEGPAYACWKARRDDGSAMTVHALLPGAGERSREHFVARARRLAAKDLPPGALRILRADEGACAYLGALNAQGTLADARRLDWDDEKRLAAFRGVCAALGKLHEAGFVHGCLRPECVLLDAEGKPVLSDVDVIDLSREFHEGSAIAEQCRPYAAPEIREGTKADVRGDVFALGRLLHFLLTDQAPDEPDERIPKLDSLDEFSERLVRTVRRATMLDPSRRFSDAVELLGYITREGPVSSRPPGDDDAEPALPSERGEERPSRPSGRGERGERGERRPQAAPRPPGKQEPRDARRLLARVRYALAGTGLALLAGACVWGRMRGEGSLELTLASTAGAGLVGLAVPSFGPRPWLSRVLVVSIFALAATFFNPAGRLARLRPAAIQAGSVAQRVAELRQRRAAGETLFQQIELAGADLRGMNLRECVLDAANLQGANLAGADLGGASLLNAKVAGADFSGARIDAVNVNALVGWKQARCDDKTAMPPGWRCDKGSPVSP
ncbi:MAG: pentapeptide repeat-containing protein, partial [Deltaproteobacteria bacterium]|nr:pentapeptide repeat-containing protein [Deltaproteobacteria bacterium]